jgi:hypothetical protein
MHAAALFAALTLAAAPREPVEPALEPLMDNSFLLEEAYNQEPGVVQHIFTFTRDRATGAWALGFTQEWPVPDERHQLSYTLTFANDGNQGGEQGLSDILLNYRYRVTQGEEVAFAPRLTAILPGSSADPGVGFRGFGAQLGLPISVKLAPRLVAHTNLGLTWVPEGRLGAARAQWLGYAAGQSFVWLTTPRLNLLAELLWSSTEALVAGHTSRAQTFTVSPGLRYGLDFPGDLQVVVGAALPIGLGPSAGDLSVLGYLSVELPYWHPDK